MTQVSLLARDRASVSRFEKALRTEARGFQALALASQRNSRAGYSAAAKRITSASRATAAASQGVRAYTGSVPQPSFGSVRIPALPKLAPVKHVVTPVNPPVNNTPVGPSQPGSGTTSGGSTNNSTSGGSTKKSTSDGSTNKTSKGSSKSGGWSGSGTTQGPG